MTRESVANRHLKCQCFAFSRARTSGAQLLRSIFHISCIVLAIILLSGCGAPKRGVQFVTTQPTGIESAKSVGTHGASTMQPMHLLQRGPFEVIADAVAAAERVAAARMEFHRTERLGLFGSLQPEERMTAIYRESPFSVMFTWHNEDSEFSQCVYVEGSHDDRVRLHRRRGLFGGAGGIVAFPPDLAVAFRKAKLSITEFGPRRIMTALQRRIDAARDCGGVRAIFRGQTCVGPEAELCDHVTLHFPPDDPHAAKLVEIHLNQRTKLPVMIELWLTKEPRRTAETPLDARYLFVNTEINPSLTSDDFRLDAERSTE